MATVDPVTSGVERLATRLLGRSFFYGWIIVCITFMTSMITAGISGYGLSFFLVPMSEDLGVSRAAFSGINVFRLAAMPLVPVLGLLVDKKHGPRLIITLGSLIGGLILMLTSTIQALWQFYLVFGVAFGLALMTMGGQLVGPAVISKWFVRKRGRAMAIGTMGISAGGFVVAPIAGWLISVFGWRMAWVLLGLLIILLITPIGALFMRRSPEDVGLRPDGEGPIAAGQGSWTDNEYPWTVRQAFKTRAMWVLLLVQILGFMSLMPTIFHGVPYILDKGHPMSVATAVATTMAFFAMVGKLPWGFLAERIHIRWVLAMCLVPTGLSLLPLVYGISLPMLYAYAVLYGLTMGGFPTLMNVAWATYFGRQHMGAIRGVVTPIGQGIAAISPVFAGWLWDLQGSYDVPFLIFAACWSVAGIVMLFAAVPKPPVPAAEAGAPSREK